MTQNPYLDEFNRITDFGRRRRVWNYSFSKFGDIYDVRSRLRKQYAYAVPDDEALSMIEKYAPNGLVEIGAGTGYWAHLLKERGLQVIPFDIEPYANKYVNGRWSAVLDGGASAAGWYPDRALFLCWPPYKSSMASDALKAYRGETVIYIGEGDRGCTGNDEFHALLRWHWTLIDECGVPQWFDLHDSLMVYRRKPVRDILFSEAML